ncbi:hypothetical protein [Corynebacterium provencense]|uniref:hypothetical protein n=1 Tax=Corynebacterium provencense TaxID=1737425 RepID=UPI00083416EA|nr:hypothetical protein [Corynebacterium provencense]
MSRRADPLVVDQVMLVPTAGPMGPIGPAGPPGEPGPVSGGPVQWHGQGAPPEYIEGAKPGDTWLDVLTGTIYELEADADGRMIR